MRKLPIAGSLAALALAIVPASGGAWQREGPEVASRPAPRSEDGRVILGASPGEPGAWTGFGSRPMLFEFDVVPEGSIIAATPPEQLRPGRFPKPKYSEIPYQPWAKALFEHRSRNRFEPYTRCKASAGPRGLATAYGTQILDVPELQRIYIFTQGGSHSYRVIYMDGRPHPDDLTPTYQGHSVGRWEGDTLVVETIGFNEKMWIDAEGSPHTEQLHLIERFTRVDFDTLMYEVTIDDPGAYTRPWESGFSMNWSWAEGFEFVCQDGNLAFELMVGTDYTSVDRSRPVVP